MHVCKKFTRIFHKMGALHLEENVDGQHLRPLILAGDYTQLVYTIKVYAFSKQCTCYAVTTRLGVNNMLGRC